VAGELLGAMSQPADQRTRSCATELVCPDCGHRAPLTDTTFRCPHCDKGLDVTYDYEVARSRIAERGPETRPQNIWRYEELLPITDRAASEKVGLFSGLTPLIRADRLGAELGLGNLYIKDDSTNRPSLSYKDRVVSMAVARAIELGCSEIGCVSTGNVGTATAALANKAGITPYIFYPANLERAKARGCRALGAEVCQLDGNYDEANRACRALAEASGMQFANITLRPFYSEGAKTLAFEVVEQLGWTYPKHLVSPVAGGTLLPRIVRGLRELRDIGLVDGDLPRVYAAQAAGCSPVVNALEAGLEYPEPVRPNTIAKSIAIGNPADGYQVIQCVNATGGAGSAVSDDAIVSAIQLLAETEGIFTEPAGGTTLAATIDLIERGLIPRDESIVVCVTGNGYKTAEVVDGKLTPPVKLSRAFKDFEAWHASREALA
jgi:threonine synthase